MGYMACKSHEEAITKFDSIKPEKFISNKDPELYKFIREINKLRPEAPAKPVVGTPFTIPTTNSVDTTTESDSGGGDCCSWCARGGVGIAPSGCYDFNCDSCYEPDEGSGEREEVEGGRGKY